MAKDKRKKKEAKKSAGKAGPDKMKKVVKKATKKAAKIAQNPIVAEVVAATLVAAAAAIRNPKKAREIALAAGDEIGGAAKTATGQGGAFWQLAMDVARRSVDALAEDQGKKATKKKK
jgi:hypothetical protein